MGNGGEKEAMTWSSDICPRCGREVEVGILSLAAVPLLVLRRSQDGRRRQPLAMERQKLGAFARAGRPLRSALLRHARGARREVPLAGVPPARPARRRLRALAAVREEYGR